MTTSIIIIGAGAAGLQAGRRLSAAGHRVTLLEAAEAPGGRILYFTPEGFSTPVEGGAEFIHGALPLSLGLMKEAGVDLRPVRSEMVRRTKPPAGGTGHGEGRFGSGDGLSDGAGSGDGVVSGDGLSDGVDSGDGSRDGAGSRDGVVSGDGGSSEEGGPAGGMGADWGTLMQKMGALTEDLPIARFLERYFSDERHSRLRDSVRRFAEGYDLADLNRASTLALYKEWSGEEGEEEYRPIGGYRPMIDLLVEECRRNGAELYFSSPVSGVSWEKGHVTVTTAEGRVFTADTVIVSVSLGVLAAGGLRFDPVLPELEQGLRGLGFGSVIKILLEFKAAFWLNEKATDRTLFLLSDEAVPTWWTQTEHESPLLTGWLAGDRMRRFISLDAAGRLDSCLRSVAGLFSRDLEWVRQQLVASLVIDWAEMPFIKGGYSFETVESSSARALLGQSFGGTLWFCGEALYEGESPGTVEAALQSGWDVAEKIIAQS